MKRNLYGITRWAALLCFTAAVLSGCEGADRGSAGSSSQNAASQNTASQNAASQNTAGQDAAGQGAAQSGSRPAGNSSTGEGDWADIAQQAEGAPGSGSSDGQDGVSAEDTYDMQNQNGDDMPAAGQQTGGNIPDGSYVSAGGETLTVSGGGSGSMSFSFGNSGISGTASVEGSQAQFGGDDGNTVWFFYEDGVINVSVENSEGFDTSGSPLIGTYTRE